MTSSDFYNDSSISQFHKDCCRLIAGFEGFRSKPYFDAGGVATIGYGTTNFSPTIASITQYRGLQLLLRDVKIIEVSLDKLFKRLSISLSDAERISIISFCYNCGYSAFEKSTLCSFLPIYSMCNKTFGRLHTATISLRDEIAKQFKRWNKCNGKVLAGLVTRRQREATIFVNNKVFN